MIRDFIYVITGVLKCAFMAAVFLAATGCGRSDRIDVYPVEGSVLYQGKPAVGAFVTFHPNRPEIENRISAATVGDDGKFRLSTYNPNDGAPAGEYRVTVVWPSIVNGRPVDDRLNGNYADVKTTSLEATVTSGSNQLESFVVR